MQGRTSKAVYFPVGFYNTSTLSAMRFDENPFTCHCEKKGEKKKKKKKGGGGCSFFFFFLNQSNQSFSTDIIAVKGLIDSVRWPCPGRGTIAVKGLIDSVRWPCPGRGTIAVKGLIDSVRWPCPGRGTIAVKGLIDSVRWPCPGRGTQKAVHEVLAQAFGVPLPTSSRGCSALPASHVVRG